MGGRDGRRHGFYFHFSFGAQGHRRNIIFAFNIGILIIAGLLFGWTQALYSIIFQFTFTQVIKALYHKYQQQTIFVVTKHPHEVSRAIYSVSCHGATLLRGVGSYENKERKVVYSIVSRGEASAVMNAVKLVDPDAFISSIRTEQVRGFFYQKPTE